MALMRSLLAALLGTSRLWANEATRLTVSDGAKIKSRTFTSFMKLRLSAEAETEAVSKMTVSGAVEVLTNGHYKSKVNGILGMLELEESDSDESPKHHHRKGQLRSHRLKKHPAHTHHKTASLLKTAAAFVTTAVDTTTLWQSNSASGNGTDASVSQNYAEVNKQSNAALQAINEMMEDNMMNLDAKTFKCDAELRTLVAELDAVRRDKVLQGALFVGFVSDLNEATNKLSIAQQGQEDKEGQLIRVRKRCPNEKAALEAQLKIVRDDLKVLEKIVNMTQCDTSENTSTSTVLLLQCRDPAGREYTKHVLKAQAVKDQVALLKQAKEIFKSVGLTIEDTDEPTSDGPLKVGAPYWTNTTGEIDAEKANEKCSVASSPKCPSLFEKFINIAGGVQDTEAELSLLLEESIKTCKRQIDNLNEQIESFADEVKDQSLALTTAEKGKLESSQEKEENANKEKQFQKEYDDMVLDCHQEMSALQEEKCALAKIRGEVMKMSSIDGNITDCQVGDWEAQSCNVTCNKGEQVWTRKVLQAADDQGYDCKVNTMKTSCNEQRCPIDCEVGDWNEWGACTAVCGGGVKTRAKPIVRHDQYAGEPCPSESQTATCNEEACDWDCETAYDWTEWSSECSKVCGGGSETRQRKIEKEASANGHCPDEHDPTRFEARPCAPHLCSTGPEPLKCTARIDLMLLIDSSGSVSEADYVQLKKMVAHLVRQMTGEAYVSAFAYSGPTNFKNWGYCSGMKDLPENATLDNYADCGMYKISEYTSNVTELAVAIENAPHIKRSTMTSKAIEMARGEEQWARQDAQTVTIVFTEDLPLSKRRTAEASKALREQGRLMYVVACNPNLDTTPFHEWASYPWQENIVRIPKCDTADSVVNLNEIISDFCPRVEFAPMPEMLGMNEEAMRQ